MIIVDSCVWVDHLRRADPTLQQLLEVGGVLSHPFIVGELALGSLRQRQIILNEMGRLPAAIVATPSEVLWLIDEASLFNLGIGYVNAHLLASTQLTPSASLWTRDKRLLGAAQRLSLAARPMLNRS